MLEQLRPSGLSAVGSLPWGAHFCQFYDAQEDLVDSLVPFFKAGLDSNEKCLWVTSEPLPAQDARTALRQAVPDIAERERRNQIEIIDHHDWYKATGKTDPDSTLRGWVEREERARADGFAGLRLTGNTYWVERSDWNGFVDYEARVSKVFQSRHIIGLCSYCLGRCQPHDILDVVTNHQFALTRRAGDWQMIESAALSMAKDELHRLNAELEHRVLERTAALEQAVRSRDEFLSVASHELKTPITSLQLYVQGMVRAQTKGTLTAEQLNARLNRVQVQCGRLERLINNLLDVSRADAKAPALQRESFDMSELVADTTERFAEEFARAGCQVTVEAREPVVGCWDRMRLEQAVTNLLQNAVRYAPGAPVHVRVQSEGPWVRIVVRDEGPGIAEKDHARIFERFAQVESERFAGGFGLGLWIVKQVAEAHEGSVTLVSRPGAGATFTLMLPCD
ncbi:MEDS domain-containing protein [Archangium lipolyticum]|uniref:MEDS domain-containing protein n=1 Tax=Archangium lipolyticum TaxID=2970465 RepID=UPI002149A231|nr:MEDS domain-containing protein [Archangium lipolyticum]